MKWLFLIFKFSFILFILNSCGSYVEEREIEQKKDQAILNAPAITIYKDDMTNISTLTSKKVEYIYPSWAKTKLEPYMTYDESSRKLAFSFFVKIYEFKRNIDSGGKAIFKCDQNAPFSFNFVITKSDVESLMGGGYYFVESGFLINFKPEDLKKFYLNCKSLLRVRLQGEGGGYKEFQEEGKNLWFLMQGFKDIFDHYQYLVTPRK